MRMNSNIVFNRMLRNGVNVNADYEVATYKGIALKSIFFLVMTILGAVGSLYLGTVNPESYLVLLMFAISSTFILSIISLLSVKACKITGTLYCLMEGTLIGIISLLVASILEGAVTVAILATIAVFAVVCVLYVGNIVKVTNRFMKFLSIFAISYIFSMLLFYIFQAITGFEGSIGLILLISAVTVFLASLYLFFDLEHIRQVVEGNYPKEYEWYASFGLAFTLIWLYIEILRLVVIIFGNRN